MSVNNIDYSTLTVDGSARFVATSCSPVMPAGAKGAVMTVEDAQIRLRDDGESVSSADGHILNVGDVLTFDSWTYPNDWRTVLGRLSVTRKGTTSGVLRISWYD